MALYRKGTASLDANGTIHGTDTKWKDQLALIRTGATIVFLEQPIKLAVISDIVSDTEMKAIATDGETAADGKYVILLNDALTVNALAQNVAETLRYYQSSETEIAQVMDTLKNIDMDNLNKIVAEIKQYKTDAEAARNQANSAKDAAAASAAEANSTKGQVQQIVDGAVGSINSAKDKAITDIGAKESAAVTHIDTEEKAAIQAINDAKGDLSTYVNNAQTAAQTATAAKNDAQAARDTAVSAKDSAAKSAQEAKDAAKSVNADNLLTKDGNLKGLTNPVTALDNLGVPGIGKNYGGEIPNSDSNQITVSGVFAGAGDSAVNHADKYAPLFSMSRYLGRAQGQMQITGGGETYIRGSGDGGKTWSTWNRLAHYTNPTFDGVMMISRVIDGRNKQIVIGPGTSDVYVSNATSNKYLQLKDDGSLQYDRRPILFSDKTMLIGSGQNINQPNIGTWIKGMRDTGGSRVMRNLGAASAGGANFQYNAAIYMVAGDTFGLLSVDYRNANVYSIGANNSSLNSSVVQVNVLWGTKNTTVDGNGFIKRASPIVKVRRDSFETNDESEGCTVHRIGVGEYLIEGCTGLNADLAWGGISGGIEIPVDINKQPLLWVDYEVNADGSIILKTFHRSHDNAPKFARNDKEGYSNGDPIDIPNDAFVSVRVEMPPNSIYNTESERLEREVRSWAKRSEWEENHATGCEEE